MPKRMTLIKPDKPVAEMTEAERRALAERIHAAMLPDPPADDSK
jgi:hypothetical protein